MTLAAAQAIDAVAALISSVAGMSGRVFTSRTWPLNDLPAWRVVAVDEEVDTLNISFPARQKHELTITAHGYARATNDLDDAMNAMAEAALSKLFASMDSVTLSPLKCGMRLLGIRRDVVTEGEAALGRITLLLLVTFITISNAPGVIV